MINSAKRYHTALRHGHYMLVYGGINDFGRVLDDLSCFDLFAK